MGLSWQQGPLSPAAIGRFLVAEPMPKRLLYAEPLRRRMRVRFGGSWIADSEKASALDQAHRAVAVSADDAILEALVEASLEQIQARFGDLDSALAVLPHLLEVPAGLNPADLRNDPMWDPLRKDPRFQKLCQDKSG